MKLTIRARKGHYDILHPKDETVGVYMYLPDQQSINLQFDVDDPLLDYLDDPHTWTDTAVQLIDAWAKRWISSSMSKALAFKDFILSHQHDIDVARLREVIDEKRAKMLKLNEDIGELEKDVLDLLKNSLTGEILSAVIPTGEQK